jgi:hypothetical protein
MTKIIPVFTPSPYFRNVGRSQLFKREGPGVSSRLRRPLRETAARWLGNVRFAQDFKVTPRKKSSPFSIYPPKYFPSSSKRISYALPSRLGLFPLPFFIQT